MALANCYCGTLIFLLISFLVDVNAGHCGFQASEFVNEELHKMIYEHPFYDSDIELAIRECCASIDKTFLERARREDIYDGTTAIGVFFHPKNSQSSKTCSKEVEFPLAPGDGQEVKELVRKSDSRMTVFNIGDSRAVLCRDGVALCSKFVKVPMKYMYVS